MRRGMAKKNRKQQEQIDRAVDLAVAEIESAVARMLTKLPKDADLNSVTEELIRAVGSSHPQMREVIHWILAAHQAVLELGVKLES